MLSTVSAVACVGAGTIGASWAQVFVRAGLDVRVYDPDPAQLARLRAESGVAPLADLADAVEGVGYVQESVPEQVAMKREIFGELDRLTPPSVVLASSASAVPMTRIADGLRHPGRCVIAHPLNPPHVLPLVEIVGGERTDRAVAQSVYAFMERIGQEPILCNSEIYGFVANRLQMALLREALHLRREGVASVGDIDRCLSDGLGLRWALLGPFAVEHTNAASIGDGLHKFSEAITAIWESLYVGSDLLGDADIEAIASEVEQLFADRPHEELTAWRDRKILELRQVKAT